MDFVFFLVFRFFSGFGNIISATFRPPSDARSGRWYWFFHPQNALCPALRDTFPSVPCLSIASLCKDTLLRLLLIRPEGRIGKMFLRCRCFCTILATCGNRLKTLPVLLYLHLRGMPDGNASLYSASIISSRGSSCCSSLNVWCSGKGSSVIPSTTSG